MTSPADRKESIREALNWQEDAVKRGGNKTTQIATFEYGGKVHTLEVKYIRSAIINKYGIEEKDVDQKIRDIFNEIGKDELVKLRGYTFSSSLSGLDGMRYKFLSNNFKPVDDLKEERDLKADELYTTFKKVNDVFERHFKIKSAKASAEKEPELEVKVEEEGGAVPEAADAATIEIKLRKVDKDAIEGFWDKQSELLHLWELVDRTDGDRAAGFLLENYIENKKQEDPAFVFPDDKKTDLLKEIKKQFEIQDRVDPLPTMAIERHPTVADGSCAFHALLGKEKDGVISCPDVETKRQEFCQWLRDKKQEGKLPESIKNVLRDYFLHWEFVPDGVKGRVDFKGLPADFNRLSSKEKEDRIEAFTDQVFEPYLAELQKKESYLLQPELQALAESLKMNVVLHQPGWGADRVNSREVALNPDAATPAVHVWYNGRNHYEKATPK